MQSAVPPGEGAMAAVLGLSAADLEQIIAEVAAEYGTLQIANYNSPGQMVISGCSAAIEAATQPLREAGASRVVPLAVSAPFHCAMLQPAAEKLATVLQPVSIGEFAFPVYANVTAEPYAGSHEVKELLISQVTHAVRWDQTIQNMMQAGYTTFIELGPKTTLSAFVRRIARELGKPALLLSLDKAEDVPALQEALQPLGLLA